MGVSNLKVPVSFFLWLNSLTWARFLLKQEAQLHNRPPTFRAAPFRPCQPMCPVLLQKKRSWNKRHGPTRNTQCTNSKCSRKNHRTGSMNSHVHQRSRHRLLKNEWLISMPPTGQVPQSRRTHLQTTHHMALNKSCNLKTIIIRLQVDSGFPTMMQIGSQVFARWVPRLWICGNLICI